MPPTKAAAAIKTTGKTAKASSRPSTFGKFDTNNCPAYRTLGDAYNAALKSGEPLHGPTTPDLAAAMMIDEAYNEANLLAKWHEYVKAFPDAAALIRQGVYYLRTPTGQKFNVNIDKRFKNKSRFHYIWDSKECNGNYSQREQPGLILSELLPYYGEVKSTIEEEKTVQLALQTETCF